MMDYTGQLGALGERSVIRVLAERHYALELALQMPAIQSYFVYSTDELQKFEVDLIEEWIDADGVKHVKAHEVKCENDTLNYWNETRLDSQSVNMLEDICKAGVSYSDGWKPKPTGNYFIELVQGCAMKEKEEYKKRLKGKDYEEAMKIVPRNIWGWALVAIDSEDELKGTLSANGAVYEGRDVWFVSYTPKPKPDMVTVEGRETGEQFEIDRNIGRQPERGFMLTRLPLECLAVYLSLDLDDTLPINDSKKEKTASIGILFPFGKLFPSIPVDEQGHIITGATYTESGATLYNDLGAWASEGKDVVENWTPQDFEVRPFKWP